MHIHATASVSHECAATRRAFLTLLLACAAYMLLVAPALATPTPMGDVLCAVVQMIYGNLGRGLATIAVIIIGVGATLGKVSWGLAVTVGVGIAIIFNAGPIVNLIGVASVAGC